MLDKDCLFLISFANRLQAAYDFLLPAHYSKQNEWLTDFCKEFFVCRFFRSGLFCMYEAGNPTCFGWTRESCKAFLDPRYSRTAVLVGEICRLGGSTGSLGIPLASEILLLEHSSRVGQEAAGKEGNGLFCCSGSPASLRLRGTVPKDVWPGRSAQPARPGPARSKHEVKATQLCTGANLRCQELPCKEQATHAGGRVRLTSHDWMQ